MEKLAKIVVLGCVGACLTLGYVEKGMILEKTTRHMAKCMIEHDKEDITGWPDKKEAMEKYEHRMFKEKNYYAAAKIAEKERFYVEMIDYATEKATEQFLELGHPYMAVRTAKEFHLPKKKIKKLAKKSFEHFMKEKSYWAAYCDAVEFELPQKYKDRAAGKLLATHQLPSVREMEMLEKRIR